MGEPYRSQTQQIPTSQNYFDLGSYFREVTTASDEAKIWCNRGLIWCYGFNHEEAVFCFEQAIKHDVACVFAYWGLAYALGPNYNKPWDFFDEEELGSTMQRTHEAIAKAEKHSEQASALEHELLSALKFRYPEAAPKGDCDIWNLEYANAMRAVYQKFPRDLDIATLFADALMNLMPWQLWDINTKKPAKDAPTEEVQSVLEQALELEGASSHPGLLHLYIHFWEMSPYPERALPIADHLRGLVPDAGHLQHMPSHLDVLCGDYRRAIASNQDANRADERFVAKRGGLNFYTLYRCHDYHFGVYAAMLAGQSKVALDIVGRLEATLSEELLRVESPPMADWLESFLSMRVHVLIRFGMWEELKNPRDPGDPKLYCFNAAMVDYGRGVAYAATGETSKAEDARKRFSAAAERVPESRTLFNNKCVDILKIAEAMLDGEIEYRKKDTVKAFAYLQSAIKCEDTLPYDEPWGWMQPTRHAYGALLLEQGKVGEAAEVYSADLGLNDELPRQLQHLNNVWALHGLHECLIRLDRVAEAKVLEPSLKLALAYADVKIKSSCFCRMDD